MQHRQHQRPSNGQPVAIIDHATPDGPIIVALRDDAATSDMRRSGSTTRAALIDLATAAGELAQYGYGIV